MRNPNTPGRSYVVAVVLGALGGGLLVALATKAIPRLMSQMMAEMMGKMPRLMMDRMKSEGFDPAEICQQMKKWFSAPPTSTGTQST